jgi:hypothetical protein
MNETFLNESVQPSLFLLYAVSQKLEESRGKKFSFQRWQGRRTKMSGVCVSVSVTACTLVE